MDCPASSLIHDRPIIGVVGFTLALVSLSLGVEAYNTTSVYCETFYRGKRF